MSRSLGSHGRSSSSSMGSRLALPFHHFYSLSGQHLSSDVFFDQDAMEIPRLMFLAPASIMRGNSSWTGTSLTQRHLKRRLGYGVLRCRLFIAAIDSAWHLDEMRSRCQGIDSETY
ncbi:hypothetical protein CLAFUW4_01688 [Fulvia fulva]|uniref:Uncharacterized protein n=1 Tax=Passalora fulva TaxID=5499 RepID=A0A9Q8L5Q2_PASFU|nr:uncharacterized protein CLAFUR5_01686 [Fulvia fulva]KAK4636009.1 hypothetical protein CLAFUR4_01686 [Fulvia fulva]KAK4636830.1 hypothetical protein CLAFUR0_01687 [Fulvia fulva]UJO11375.1 hypothetical protein CLAFUR5_01686 [Fulvia fulva]WPV08497.1 hypothetical protein CLAFUW4_01688 [Fulvia fulva]WPV25169.1 hypothetical protein CLAFUW7_01690 [Fulvia fulva]